MLESFRRPEYTDDRRCWPCTIVNVGLLAVAGALLALVAPFLAVGVVAVGLAAVALRGYVVPYTPRFAPRLVESLPVSFDHGPEPGDTEGFAGDDADPEELLGALVAEGVVVDDGAELGLADDVREEWVERMRALRDGDDLLARAAAAAPFDGEGRRADRWVVVDGEQSVWLTEPVAIAETAVIETLAERGVPEGTRVAAAAPMRLFLPECPACGGPVEETVWRDCCGGGMGALDSPEVEVLACADCEAVLFEF